MTSAAAVSKATFYGNFDSMASCVLATFELATQSLLAVVQEACPSDAATEPDVAEVLSRVLEFLAAEPALARVLTDSALDDVPGVSAARNEFIAGCSSLLASAQGEGGVQRERRGRYLLRGAQGWLSTRLAAGDTVDHPDDLARILSATV